MFAQFLAAFQFAVGVTLPSVFLLLFGFFLKRVGQMDDDFSASSSRLMFNWALPALLFFSIAESEVAFGGQLGMLSAGICLTLSLFAGAEWIAARKLARPDRGVFVQGVYRGNTAIIGLAFCANAYGPEGVAVGAIFAGAMTLLYNVLAVITLSRSLGRGGDSPLAMLGAMAKNPLIIAILLALAWRATGLRLPASLSQAGHYLAATALPLALICIGAAFEFGSLFQLRDFSLWTSLIRVTVAPAGAALFGLAFGLERIPFGVLFLMSCAPIAAAAYVMTKAMGGNDKAAANIIGITTVLSMICAPLWITLMRWAGRM